MKERLLVYLRGSRIGFIEFNHDANSREFSYDAEYLTSSGACPISFSLPLYGAASTHIVKPGMERLPRAAAELAVEMSDEGYPSPIYARIGEVIREQAGRVKGVGA